jgi:diadenosine tetraphosphate (Ap4A) HIT family hydrolase
VKEPGCALCDGSGGVVVFEGAQFRVVRALEEGFPAFYRVVWSEHVKEFSDLAPADRRLCIDAVLQVEETLRAHLHPAKINLAALGNMVPHLHWHVVARFEWDSHFPAPVWAAALREAPAPRLAAVEQLRPALEHELALRLAGG